MAKSAFLNKINGSITPNSVSKLVSSSLDTIGVNNIKNPIQLSPKSRGRVQFFEDTFGLKLNLSGKLDPDFNTPSVSKVSNMILLPETMENIRQFRKDYGNYLTPKSLERINEFEAQYAKTNALNSELFKTASALGTGTDVNAATTTGTLGEIPTANTTVPTTETIQTIDSGSKEDKDASVTEVTAESSISVDSKEKKDDDEGEDEVEEEGEKGGEEEVEEEEEDEEEDEETEQSQQSPSQPVLKDIKLELNAVTGTSNATDPSATNNDMIGMA